jgi:hypothetical protein
MEGYIYCIKSYLTKNKPIYRIDSTDDVNDIINITKAHNLSVEHKFNNSQILLSKRVKDYEDKADLVYYIMRQNYEQDENNFFEGVSEYYIAALFELMDGEDYKYNESEVPAKRIKKN